MPMVLFRTNLPDEKVTQEFHSKFSAKLAEVLGKGEEHVSVTIVCGARMSREGSFDPMCEVHIISLAFNTRPQTLAATRALTPFITTHTSIPGHRVVVSFQSPEPFMVGSDGNVR